LFASGSVPLSELSFVPVVEIAPVPVASAWLLNGPAAFGKNVSVKLTVAVWPMASVPEAACVLPGAPVKPAVGSQARLRSRPVIVYSPAASGGVAL
jgi:hypothetical protein